MNILLCSNHNLYESSDKTTIIETWKIAESIVINGDGDLSLTSSPIAQNEIRKTLEVLSGTGEAQVQEIDEEEKAEEEIRKKKFPLLF